MELIAVASYIFSPHLFLLLAIGVSVGILGGALPGISSTTTVALIATFAYTMPTVDAVMFLAATQVGSTYGGSISATVLNIPGTPASAATALEGYPMAKRGEGERALSLNVMSSFCGNTIGALLLLLIMSLAMTVALSFGSWEMFWFSVFGLVVCAQLSRGDFIKGLIAACAGLTVSFIGLDPIHGVGAVRYTYGIPYLRDGVKLIPAMVGLYGMSEVFESLIDHDAKPLAVNRSRFFETAAIWRRRWLTLRVSLLGFIIGVIPGVGANIASWIGYNHAKSSSRKPERFGHGAEEGLIGSEAANNACVPGAYAPLLALGVPGDGVTAIVLAILTVQGVQPGPSFMEKSPGFMYLLVLSILLAGLIFLLIGSFLGKAVIRLLSFPLPLIMASVVCLCAIGAFSASYRFGDIYLMFFFGLIGLAMRWAGIPIAPMILGLVIGGDLVDSNFRRAVLAGKGSLLPFFTRPVSLILLIILALLMGKEVFGPAIKRKWLEWRGG
jgi:putative tricarboxylic transport membrane protein